MRLSIYEMVKKYGPCMPKKKALTSKLAKFVPITMMGVAHPNQVLKV